LVSSSKNIPEGAVEVRFEFEPTGKPDIVSGKGAPGRAQLYINGELAGEGKLPVTIPLNIGLTEGLTCGRDPASPVSGEYAAPFEFTGTIHDVVIDVSGDLIVDQDAKMRGVMAHQ
jgi:arylsulfatase